MLHKLETESPPSAAVPLLQMFPPSPLCALGPLLRCCCCCCCAAESCSLQCHKCSTFIISSKSCGTVVLFGWWGCWWWRWWPPGVADGGDELHSDESIDLELLLSPFGVNKTLPPVELPTSPPTPGGAPDPLGTA